jgi:hypothetical protein
MLAFFIWAIIAKSIRLFKSLVRVWPCVRCGHLSPRLLCRFDLAVRGNLDQAANCLGAGWPVCAISETAAPHRVGAALTYAMQLKRAIFECPAFATKIVRKQGEILPLRVQQISPLR